MFLRRVMSTLTINFHNFIKYLFFHNYRTGISVYKLNISIECGVAVTIFTIQKYPISKCSLSVFETTNDKAMCVCVCACLCVCLSCAVPASSASRQIGQDFETYSNRERVALPLFKANLEEV